VLLQAALSVRGWSSASPIAPGAAGVAGFQCDVEALR